MSYRDNALSQAAPPPSSAVFPWEKAALVGGAAVVLGGLMYLTVKAERSVFTAAAGSSARAASASQTMVGVSAVIGVSLLTSLIWRATTRI